MNEIPLHIPNESDYHLQTKVQPKTSNDQHDFGFMHGEALCEIKNEQGKRVNPELFFGEYDPETLNTLSLMQIKEVCKQIAEWNRQGKHACISVNIRASAITSDMVEKIIEAISSSNIQHGQLELEITEHDTFTDQEAAVELISLLKQHGVKIAIDDFPAVVDLKNHALENLFLLRELVDTVKLDKSFLRLDEADVRWAIDSIRKQIGPRCNVDIVIEGIEMPEQIDYMRSLLKEKGFTGIGMQGYLFARPVTPEEFATDFLIPSSVNA